MDPLKIKNVDSGLIVVESGGTPNMIFFAIPSPTVPGSMEVEGYARMSGLPKEIRDQVREALSKQ